MTHSDVVSHKPVSKHWILPEPLTLKPASQVMAALAPYVVPAEKSTSPFATVVGRQSETANQ